MPKRWLIVPDCHHPYVHKVAWRALLNFAAEYRPHGAVLLGDFADAYAVSAHGKDPRVGVRLVDELERVAHALGEVGAACGPNLRVRHYVMGNHEARLDRYIERQAPALHGLVSYQGALGDVAKKWRFTAYGDYLKVGKMHFTHDVGKAGTGAARAAMQDFQGNVVIGHNHRMEVFYEGNARGERHVGASLGWLGDPKAISYMHKVKVSRAWVHGWGTMDLYPNGNVRLHAHPLF